MLRKINAILTVTGISKKGFFIPYRYANDLSVPIYPEITNHFYSQENTFREYLSAINSYGDFISNNISSEKLNLRWNQDWFPRSDAAAAYTFIRKKLPKIVIEIGSGHSTRFLLKGMIDQDLDSKLICIDPNPRAKIPIHKNIFHINKTLQNIDLDIIKINPNDILFVDSSHILMPGSDVDIIVNRLLPRFPIGSIVHFHDILLPDDYPKEWKWRNYNEQSIISTLISSGSWQVEWSSHYILTKMYSEFNSTVLSDIEILPNALETSIWLKKLK